MTDSFKDACFERDQKIRDMAANFVRNGEAPWVAIAKATEIIQNNKSTFKPFMEKDIK